MKKQDSLDDLIISDNISSSKNSSTKNILTIVGLVLAVLIGAILLTKMLLQEPQKPKIPIEENLTNSALIKDDTNESNNSDINDSMIESDAEPIIKDETNSSSYQKITPEDINRSKVTTTDNTQAAISTKKAINKTVKKEIAAKPVHAKTNQISKVKTEALKKDINKTDIQPANATIEPKKEKASQNLKTDTKPIEKPTNENKELLNNQETFYIQVGAFSNKPNDEFVSIIKKNGYNYKIVKSQSGFSKILIGPYSGKESANNALAKIRDRINKSAFIVK